MQHNRTIAATAIAAAAVVATLSAMPAAAQRAGQSVSIQYGIVTGARQVDLKSGAVPGGALVGGTLGVIAGSGKSSGKKVRNAIIGGAAGAAIAGAAQGSQQGMLYEVNVGAGGVVQIVTDQREIRPGDCVAVERSGDTTNVRRMSMSYCDQANQAAVQSVQGEAREEASQCETAKQQLVDAKTADEADLAMKKISLLCDD
jgi:outer membrane lipoprotein SlyB